MNRNLRLRRRAAGALLGFAAIATITACNSSEPNTSGPSGEQPTSGRSVPTPSLTIATQTTHTAGNPLTFDVEFQNPGDADVTIITPQDGSEHGMVSPIYSLDVTRLDDEKPATLMGRCGNHGATYDKNTMRVISPSTTTAVKVFAPLDLPGPGRYRATLTYTVKPNTYPGPNYSAPTMEKPNWRAWPAGVFVGSATSNAVEFEVVE